MLTHHDVNAAYQLLLGRPPESEAVIENYIRNASFDTLRRTIIESTEFLRRAAKDPAFFNAHPCVLAHSSLVRLTLRQLEHLASLELPLFGRSVFCANVGVGMALSFFLDRFCKVSVSTLSSGLATDASAVLESIQRSEATETVEVYDVDLSKVLQAEAPRTWEIVVCSDISASPQGIQRCMANLSALSSNLLVLDMTVAVGSGNYLVNTRTTTDGIVTDFALPTREWVWSQLARSFRNVYVPRTQPCHDAYALTWADGQATCPTSRAIFVASRTPLDETKLSSTLLEEQAMHL